MLLYTHIHHPFLRNGRIVSGWIMNVWSYTAKIPLRLLLCIFGFWISQRLSTRPNPCSIWNVLSQCLFHLRPQALERWNDGSCITKVRTWSMTNSFRLINSLSLLEYKSLSNDVWPPVNGLFHSLICVIPMASSPKPAESSDWFPFRYCLRYSKNWYNTAIQIVPSSLEKWKSDEYQVYYISLRLPAMDALYGQENVHINAWSTLQLSAR